MKLTDLRALLRLRGGVPGSLRKAELIAQCQVLRNPSPLSTPRALANANFATIQTREYGTQKPFPPKSTDANAKFYSPTNGNNEKPKFEIPVPNNAEPVKRWSRNTVMNNAQAIPVKPMVKEVPTQPGMSTASSCEAPLWTQDDSDQPWRQTAAYPYGPDRGRRIERRNGEMELSFLGTASCIPGITRGVSCMALRYITDLWLFDCGEGTQVQLRKSELRSSRINKIFITHLHGDHAFGLAGVLCMIGQGVSSERDRLQAEGNGEVIDAIDIYGPEGIRSMVRAVMQLSYSKIAVPHRIHELKEIPCTYNDKPPPLPVVNTRPDYFCGERLGGTDIYPDASGRYHLFTENGMTVHAAPMVHTVPCVGYVVTEADRPGALMPEKVADVVQRNKAGLHEKYKAMGRHSMSFYQDLKLLKPEEVFTFPDGTEIRGKDVVLPSSKGRKVVFMGDTSSGRHIAELAQDCDILVHEATNAYFPEDGNERRHTYGKLEEDTISHGHSTPEMAGRFAAQIRAKQLIMSHFSSRYNGDSSLRSMQIMWRIEDMARRAYVEEQRRLSRGGASSVGSGGSAGGYRNRGGRNDLNQHRNAPAEKPVLTEKNPPAGAAGEVVLGENDVLAAWDFMCVSVDMKGVEQREKGKFKAVTTYD